METNFATVFQNVLRLGLIDDRYPLDHSCVQLPNGWYGINSIIGSFGEIAHNKGYDELLLPTVSTRAMFNGVKPELMKGIDEKVLRITHTGANKLDDPFFLSGRPELIIPKVEQVTARSYRDLPIRRLMKGFRYINPPIPDEISLVTDTEFPALDCEAIFLSEEQYNQEKDMLVAELEQFIADKLKLSVFSVDAENCKLFFTVLPNKTIMEVARLTLFGSELSQGLEFTVADSTQKLVSPFIFDLGITAKLFAAVVAAHSEADKVVLPIHCMRTMGTSYGVDVSAFTKVRIENSVQKFSEEKFAKVMAQGAVFVLLPAEDGKIELRTQTGSEVLAAADVEAKIIAMMEEREKAICEKEKELFKARFDEAVKFLAKDEAAPEGFTVIGTQGEKVVAARLFLPIQ